MARKIEIVIAGDTTGLKKAVGEATTITGKLKGSFSSIGSVAAGVFSGGALLGGLSKATDLIGDSVRAAQEDEQAQTVLAKTLKNVTGATRDQISATEDWITKTTNATGILDDDLRPSLGSLVRATGDVSKAQKLMKTAMDVSTATGKPLQTVALALSKAYAGNVSGLGRLGIQTKDAAGKTLSFDKVIEQLNKKMGGATAAAANTSAGKMKILQARFSEAKESLGAALLPVLTKLAGILVEKVIPAVEEFADWVGRNKDTILAIAAAISPFVVALGTILIIQKVTTALAAAKVAMLAFNASLLANPVLLIVAGIAALIAGLILAYQKVGWFRAFVDASFKAIKTVVGVVVNFIKDNWKLMLIAITGPLGVAVALVVKHWDTIKNAVSAVFNWVKTNWPLLLAIITGPIGIAVAVVVKNFDAIKNAFSSVIGFVQLGVAAIVGFFTGLPGKIGSALSGLSDILSAPFKAGVNFIKDAWNNVLGGKGFSFSIPDFPGIPHRGESFSFKIPYLKDGGIATGPMSGYPAILHGTEAVIPLDGNRGRSILPQRDMRPIYLVVNVDPMTGEQTVQQLQSYQRVKGPVPIKVAG